MGVPGVGWGTPCRPHDSPLTRGSIDPTRLTTTQCVALECSHPAVAVGTGSTQVGRVYRVGVLDVINVDGNVSASRPTDLAAVAITSEDQQPDLRPLPRVPGIRHSPASLVRCVGYLPRRYLHCQASVLVAHGTVDRCCCQPHAAPRTSSCPPIPAAGLGRPWSTCHCHCRL